MAHPPDIPKLIFISHSPVPLIEEILFALLVNEVGTCVNDRVPSLAWLPHLQNLQIYYSTVCVKESMPSPAAWSLDLWWQQDQWSYSVEISQFRTWPVWKYRVKTFFNFFFSLYKAERASSSLGKSPKLLHQSAHGAVRIETTDTLTSFYKNSGGNSTSHLALCMLTGIAAGGLVQEVEPKPGVISLLMKRTITLASLAVSVAFLLPPCFAALSIVLSLHLFWQKKKLFTVWEYRFIISNGSYT